MRKRDAIKLRMDDKVDIRPYEHAKDVWKPGYVVSARKFRGVVRVKVQTAWGTFTRNHLDVRPTKEGYHNNLTTLVRILRQETDEAMKQAQARIAKRVAKECPDTNWSGYNPSPHMRDMQRLDQDTLSATMVLTLGDFQCPAQDLVQS